MANYPTLFADPAGSSQKIVDDLTIDEWPNGSIRGRAFFSTGRKQWTLQHTMLTTAEKNTWETFYTTNRLLAFTYVSPFDGVTYNNLRFTTPPDTKPHAGVTWDCSISFRSE